MRRQAKVTVSEQSRGAFAWERQWHRAQRPVRRVARRWASVSSPPLKPWILENAVFTQDGCHPGFVATAKPRWLSRRRGEHASSGLAASWRLRETKSVPAEKLSEEGPITPPVDRTTPTPLVQGWAPHGKNPLTHTPGWSRCSPVAAESARDTSDSAATDRWPMRRSASQHLHKSATAPGCEYWRR